MKGGFSAGQHAHQTLMGMRREVIGQSWTSKLDRGPSFEIFQHHEDLVFVRQDAVEGPLRSGLWNFGAEKIRACMKFIMQALDIYGARTRNRTGTPLRAGDFKSHASTSFAIRAAARCSRVGNI